MYTVSTAAITDHSQVYTVITAAITNHSTAITDHSQAYTASTAAITDHSQVYTASTAAITNHSQVYTASTAAITDHSTAAIMDLHSQVYTAITAATMDLNQVNMNLPIHPVSIPILKMTSIHHRRPCTQVKVTMQIVPTRAPHILLNTLVLLLAVQATLQVKLIQPICYLTPAVQVTAMDALHILLTTQVR